jgi:hypothetical protein
MQGLARVPLPERDDAGQKRTRTDQVRPIDAEVPPDSQHRHIEVGHIDGKNREAENDERCPKQMPHARSLWLEWSPEEETPLAHRPGSGVLRRRSVIL